jgi:heme A synthase
MYLGYRQYQLLFDLAGLVILLSIVACLMVLAWPAYRRKSTAVKGLAVVVAALCMVQVYRGAMVTESAWVVMLGAIENSSGAERDRRVSELRSNWRARTMRAFDWYFVSKKWSVCHSLWPQKDCVTPVASEQAVGVAREILDGIATSLSGASTAK